MTVISHVVQPGADSNWTDDRSLRLEVRLKPNGEGGSRWVDDGSTYSNTKSWVEHSEQGEHVVCITDNYWNATGSGALGSGLTIHADVVGNEMLLKASVTSHATGRNLTVCDGVTAEFPLTGDTSQDMTDPVGCDNSAELSATGTLATGFDFACRIAAVVGQGQTVVTGVVGPP